jgi:RNA polymerase sigma-70 factor, ECF subfamily
MDKYEKDLLYMAKKGDIEAYEKLIEAYERKVFSLIFAVIGDRSEAGMVTQDIFVKVYLDIKRNEKVTGITQLIYGVTKKVLKEKCENSNCNIGPGNKLYILLH